MGGRAAIELAQRRLEPILRERGWYCLIEGRVEDMIPAMLRPTIGAEIKPGWREMVATVSIRTTGLRPIAGAVLDPEKLPALWEIRIRWDDDALEAILKGLLDLMRADERWEDWTRLLAARGFLTVPLLSDDE